MCRSCVNDNRAKKREVMFLTTPKQNCFARIQLLAETWEYLFLKLQSSIISLHPLLIISACLVTDPCYPVSMNYYTMKLFKLRICLLQEVRG